MKVVARRVEGFAHDVEIEGRQTIRVDEPPGAGGADTGPSPTRLVAASLASCVAITVEMYAERKGWDMTGVEVDCDYTPAERGRPTQFNLVLRLPESLSEEQVERLTVIAAKCPIHRTLEGEVTFDERVQRVAPV